jgi:hypothetical protein
MKKALVIGIDAYEKFPLSGCVADANAIANLLKINGDGSPNFSVKVLVSTDQEVNTSVLLDSIAELFSGDAETAVLFFAGHGIIVPETNAGYIVSQNGSRGAWGVTLSDILNMAATAYPRIRSTVIILDSCHSGYAGEIQALNNPNFAGIGNGVTILTACHREGYAEEVNEHGIFTQMLIDGLSGGCSDICGRITPAALYAHIDQTLGPWDQRPMYKANVQSFITLRQVTPKVPLETLRRLKDYFPDPAYQFPLDPTFEPERDNVPEEIMAIEPILENVSIFKELQTCNRHGLVVPVDAEHMYYAAINSKSCRLTALGAHFRNLSSLGRI